MVFLQRVCFLPIHSARLPKISPVYARLEWERGWEVSSDQSRLEPLPFSNIYSDRRRWWTKSVTLGTFCGEKEGLMRSRTAVLQLCMFKECGQGSLLEKAPGWLHWPSPDCCFLKQEHPVTEAAVRWRSGAIAEEISLCPVKTMPRDKHKSKDTCSHP